MTPRDEKLRRAAKKFAENNWERSLDRWELAEESFLAGAKWKEREIVRRVKALYANEEQFAELPGCLDVLAAIRGEK